MNTRSAVHLNKYHITQIRNILLTIHSNSVYSLFLFKIQPLVYTNNDALTVFMLAEQTIYCLCSVSFFIGSSAKGILCFCDFSMLANSLANILYLSRFFVCDFWHSGPITTKLGDHYVFRDKVKSQLKVLMSEVKKGH